MSADWMVISLFKILIGIIRWQESKIDFWDNGYTSNLRDMIFYKRNKYLVTFDKMVLHVSEKELWLGNDFVVTTVLEGSLQVKLNVGVFAKSMQTVCVKLQM